MLEKALAKTTFYPVVPFPLKEPMCCEFKFNEFECDKDLNQEEYTAFLESFVKNHTGRKGAKYGIGGYLEDRGRVYSKSPDFDLEDGTSRSIHLGVDIWAPVKTPIYAPREGIVHSFADNSSYGNYGPTIILEHVINTVTFYTLYGHLSKESLIGLKKGQRVIAGEQIATLGSPTVNVGWPAHLHFQVITDMLGKEGDFPGVSSKKDLEYWKNYCINPNLILKTSVLK